MIRRTDPLLDGVTPLLVHCVALLLRDVVTNIPRNLVTILMRLVTEEVSDSEALLAPGHLESSLTNLLRNILADDVRHGEAVLFCVGGTFC